MSEKVICSHKGCTKEIDISETSLCGDCGEYFCIPHRDNNIELEDGTLFPICDSCEEAILDSEEWYKDPIDNCIIKILG